MMTLLSHALAVRAQIYPETMALSLEERNSTATITLGPDAPEIKINDWLRDETEPGKGIVWRVKTVSESVETQTRTVSLEHIVSALADIVMFGEVTPKTITGNSKATVCTAREAAVYALNYQSLWRLGDLEAGNSHPYSFNGESIFAALETVTGSLKDMQWEYDLTALPFVLHIRKQDTGVRSEMRMRRNISTMKVQVDKTRMYTRHYPIGKNNLHIDGDYLSKNESVWGRVDKVETDQSQDTKEKLQAWSQERLDRHCEPLVTVTVTGLELSEATGEELDHIVVGRQCRIPLPDYGTAMTERVTKMSWADKIREPEKVTVTLANNMEDVASIINSMASSGGRGGRASAKNAEEDHAWLVDTTDHVAMVAEAVAGEGAAENWSRVAEVLVDGKGIHQRVTKTEGDLVKAEASIEVNEKAIMQEVKDRSDKDNELSGRITVTANAITQEVARASAAEGTLSGRITTTAEAVTTEVTRAKNAENTLSGRITTTAEAVTTEVTRAKNAENTLSGRITVTADSVTQIVETVGSDGEVTAASICVAINNGGSSATINASKIYLLGQTIANTITADYIDSKISTIGTLHGIAASFSGNIYSASALMAPYIYVGSSGSYVNISDPILAVQIDGPSNNTYKLQYKSASNSSWTDAGSFSRATTLSGAWSGGVYTVTASPQGNTNSTTLRYMSPTGDVTVTGKTVSRVFRVQYGPDEDHLYDTGFNPTVTIDATNVYNNGYAAAHIASSWNANNDTLTVTKTTSGSTNSASFTVSAVANATYNSTTHKYTAIAQAKVDGTIRGDAASYTTGTEAYSDGYSAGAPSSATAGARSGSTYNWSMVVTKGDGTTSTLTVDCTAIYTDARTGYTQGTFTAETVYVSSSSGTTYYKAGTALTLYTAGTATTYYQAGTTTKYARGNTVTVTPVGNVRYFVAHTSGTPDAGSTWYTMATTKPSSGTYQTMYFAGTAATYYKGDGGSFTVQGSSVSVTPVGTAQTVTPIDGGTALPLVTATRYKKS